MNETKHTDSRSVERIATRSISRSWLGTTAGVNDSELMHMEPLHYSHSSASSSLFLTSMYIDNVPWENLRKRQKGDTSWVGVRIEEQRRKLDPA